MVLDFDKERRASLYAWVDRVTELPMLVLSVLILPFLLVPEFFELSHSMRSNLEALDWVIWSAFALELTLKTYLSPDRKHYIVTHWFDVLIVALPFLRPLRLANSARAVNAFRSARVIALFARLLHSVKDVLSQHGLNYVLGISLVILIGSAVLVEHLEGNAGGNIDGYPDALWWALTTVTTVGYGDRFPVTAEGRAIAVLLMVAGITTFTVFTANLAAFFAQGHDADEPKIGDLMREIQLLRATVEELTERLSDEQTSTADAMATTS